MGRPGQQYRAGNAADREGEGRGDEAESGRSSALSCRSTFSRACSSALPFQRACLRFKRLAGFQHRALLPQQALSGLQRRAPVSKGLMERSQCFAAPANLPSLSPTLDTFGLRLSVTDRSIAMRHLFRSSQISSARGRTTSRGDFSSFTVLPPCTPQPKFT